MPLPVQIPLLKGLDRLCLLHTGTHGHTRAHSSSSPVLLTYQAFVFLFRRQPATSGLEERWVNENKKHMEVLRRPWRPGPAGSALTSRALLFHTLNRNTLLIKSKWWLFNIRCCSGWRSACENNEPGRRHYTSHKVNSEWMAVLNGERNTADMSWREQGISMTLGLRMSCKIQPQ